MKTKLGIVGCGFLGNIVADAWKKGLLPTIPNFVFISVS